MSATASLQAEVNELKAKVRELSQTPEEREEAARERYNAALASRPEPENPAFATIRHDIERAQQRMRNWLYRCGISEDASDEVKRIACHLDCAASQNVFVELITACAGVEFDNSKPVHPQMAAAFPTLTPAIQSAIVKAVDAYAIQRSQVRGW